MKVVFVGAHVDDWGVCAGTLARYAREGHDVVCFSFTPGDSQSMASAHHMSVDKLTTLRRDDAMRGTKIIGAQLKILSQHNQNMRVDPEVYDDFNKTLAPEKPRYRLRHVAARIPSRSPCCCEYRLQRVVGERYEVCVLFLRDSGSSEMTAQQFVPNRWVDIESVTKLKREYITANTLLEGWWSECEMWAKFRGGEYGCKYAEAFVHISTVASVESQNISPRSWFGGGVQINHD